MKSIGQYILANDRNAIILALVSALLLSAGLPGDIIAAAIIGLVTIQKGPKSGLILLAWVALPTVSLYILRLLNIHETLYLPYVSLLLKCIVIWLLAWVFRATQSWLGVLGLLVILGVTGVITIHIYEKNLIQYWSQMLGQIAQSFMQSGLWRGKNPADIQRVFQQFAPITTGVIAVANMAVLFILMAVIRWWQTVTTGSGQFGREFRAIRIPRLFSIIMLILTIGLLFRIPVWIDAYPVLMFPYIIAGLSLVHSIVHKRNWGFILVFIYIGLVFLFLLFAVILTLVGYIDSWYDFRNRQKDRTNSDNS